MSLVYLGLPIAHACWLDFSLLSLPLAGTSVIVLLHEHGLMLS